MEQKKKDLTNNEELIGGGLTLIPYKDQYAKCRYILEALESLETSVKEQEDSYEDDITSRETVRNYHVVVQESTFKGEERKKLRQKLIEILVEDNE